MIFIALQEVIEDQSVLIAKYGGAPGIRDMGLLASAIEMPKATMFGEDLHPTIFDKAAAYLFHVVRNHPFVDGNKRSSAVVALTFLRQNGVVIRFTEKEARAFEELVVGTAAGKITKEQISKFLKKCHKSPHKSLRSSRKKIARKRKKPN